ncbi:MAG: pyruvate ferredoxin oxidoreductase [Deltaproteobacteria bacterium]|nr:pyruvate ferredoxin oxidoreductase [Deltaproteobacteria bacterium]
MSAGANKAGKRTGIEISLAISEAAKMARVDAVAAYPITPQTHVVEHLSELVASGELDAEYICVESEHSALSACIGTQAAGARTFTATSAQGLELMHEILYIAAGMRMPIVMAVANRALSAPLSIWNDHSDVMACRDTGWIQVFAENGQDAFDQVICAFRFGEDRRVQMPVMVNFDGFTLSHVVESVEFPAQELVDSYLPPYRPENTLHPDRPLTLGAFAMPEIYTETRMAHEAALLASRPVIDDAWAEWGKLTGRHYKAVETYRTEGAETLFVTMGGLSENAMEHVDAAREKGKKVGLVHIRLWRPFPIDEMRKVLCTAAHVVVMDRALPPGAHGGPVFTEVKSALYDQSRRPTVHGYIAGLGGRDVTPADFGTMYDLAMAAVKEGKKEEFRMIGVRS